MELLRGLTRSNNNHIAYRNAFNAVETASCIPVIGEASFPFSPLFDKGLIYPTGSGVYFPLLRAILHKSDGAPIDSPNVPARHLINFSDCREMAEICYTALRFQTRPPPPEYDNIKIQAWLNKEFEAAVSRNDQWYLEKAAEMQQREDDHSDIRYESPLHHSRLAMLPLVARILTFLRPIDRRGLEAAGF